MNKFALFLNILPSPSLDIPKKKKNTFSLFNVIPHITEIVHLCLCAYIRSNVYTVLIALFSSSQSFLATF